jgi:hypothetical protein
VAPTCNDVIKSMYECNALRELNVRVGKAKRRGRKFRKATGLPKTS